MTVGSHLRAIWGHRWRVLIVALIVAGAVYAFEGSRPSVYRATAQLNVVLPAVDAAQSGSQAVQLYYSQTYAVLGTTDPVLNKANTFSKLDLSAAEARSRISVTSSALGALVISATGPSKAAATALTSGEAAALTSTVNAQEQTTLDQQAAPLNKAIAQLQARLATETAGSPAYLTTQTQLASDTSQLVTVETQGNIQITVLSPALAAPAAISPKAKSYAILAFVTALILVGELSALLEYRADRFADEDIEEDVRRHLGLPVLATVTNSKDDANEGFRSLRTNLNFMRDKPNSVAIVGTEAVVGRTFVAIGLARMVAAGRLEAGLIEADLRGPSIARALEIDPEPGLVDVMLGASVDECVQLVGTGPALRVLPAGAVTGESGWLLAERFRVALDPMKFCDTVIVDTPPEGRFADALAIASQCDATILVIDPAVSRRRSAKRTIARLRQVQANPVGVVINRLPPRSGRKHRRQQSPKNVAVRTAPPLVPASRDNGNTGVPVRP
jgi:Mrp family chromosome partitioning ATPase/capsular polysaccharide biosynthesis protein